MSGNERSKSLSATQKRAIAALLTGRDVRSAAAAANVGESTLRRWLADDAFVTALRQAENDLIDQVTRRMLTAQEGALAVVVSILADKGASASVRLRAAALVMDNFIKLRELRNVEDRLVRLEEMAGIA